MGGGVGVVDEEMLHAHCSVVLDPLYQQRLLMLCLCGVVWCRVVWHAVQCGVVWCHVVVIFVN